MQMWQKEKQKKNMTSAEQTLTHWPLLTHTHTGTQCNNITGGLPVWQISFPQGIGKMIWFADVLTDRGVLVQCVRVPPRSPAKPWQLVPFPAGLVETQGPCLCKTALSAVLYCLFKKQIQVNYTFDIEVFKVKTSFWSYPCFNLFFSSVFISSPAGFASTWQISEDDNAKL